MKRSPSLGARNTSRAAPSISNALATDTGTTMDIMTGKDLFQLRSVPSLPPVRDDARRMERPNDSGLLKQSDRGIGISGPIPPVCYPSQ